MRRAGLLIAFGAAALPAAGVVACADLLGVDDGLPRRDDASVRDAVSADAAFEAAPTLACGATTCNAAAEACCRTAIDAGPDAASFQFRCLADASACASDVDALYACDRGASCVAQGHAGQVCCGRGGPTSGSSCTALADCLDGGRVLCAPGNNAECPLDSGLTCQASAVNNAGFSVCK